MADTVPPDLDPGETMRAVAAAVEPRLDDAPGHGITHAWRVFRLGRRIADAEGADPVVVGAAALVHDLHWSADEWVHPRETLPTVRRILDTTPFPDANVDPVCDCVEVHDEYPFESDPDEVDSVAAAVLQDADNLDALGAVGVARLFAVNGSFGNPLYVPDADGPALPPNPTSAPSYEKTGPESSGSAVEHAHEKILRLRDAMNTDTGCEIAGGRHDYLVEFLDRLDDEWRSED